MIFDRFAKECLRALAGLNIAVVFRAIRFGPGDARERSEAAFYAVDPLGETRSKPKRRGALPVKLGGFDVTVPLGNPLFETYTNNPRFNSEIGRIARATHSKYPDMVAIDIGANIGDTAAIIRGACEAAIICIEGDQSLAGALSQNMARLGNVRSVHAYLGDRHEERRVSVAKGGWNSTLMPADVGPSVTIEFTTLDDLAEDVERQRIKLIKIDIEGYEYPALRGAKRTLLAGHPVVIFEHNRDALSSTGMDGTAIFSELKELGYRSTLIWDNNGRFLFRTSLEEMELIEDLHEYIAYPGKQLGCIYYFDICVFHQEDEDLAERCVIAERAEREARNGGSSSKPIGIPEPQTSIQ